MAEPRIQEEEDDQYESILIEMDSGLVTPDTKKYTHRNNNTFL